MLLNTTQINDGQLNGELQFQSFTLLSIEKNIEESISAEGSLLTIEKNLIEGLSAYTILSIEKQIFEQEPFSFFTRFGFQPIVTIGSYTVADNELHGGIVITKQVDDNHTAQVTLRLYPKVHDLYFYQGKSIIIRVRENDGVKTLFTGVIDVPSIDALNEKLTLSCVADRRVLIGDLTSVEPFIGSYSDVVFGESSSTYDRIVNRLTTVDQSLDFDSGNNYALTSWTPKATADYSYNSDDVYRRAPTVKIESAAKLVNKVNISLDYGYQRLHHRETIFSWEHTYAPTNPITGEGGICAFLEDRPTMPTKELIRSAAQGTGWPTRDDYYFFGKQFKSGSYRCSGVWSTWSTLETGYFNAGITDSNNVPVLDASGNQLTRSVQTVIADNTDLYTMNAEWRGSTRFNQNIKESFSAVVRAPSSINVYGPLEANEGYAYTASNGFEEWEVYNSYKDPPAGKTIYYDAFNSSYLINGDEDRSIFNLAFVVALNKAKATILKSHRDTRVTFQTPLQSALELKHTVSLTGRYIRGKGKCDTITHYLNISKNSNGEGGTAYTEIQFSQYRGTSSVTATPLAPQSSPATNNVPVQPPIGLDTHLGEDPSQEGAENWTGYVGNIAITQTIPTQGLFPSINYTRSNFQESFIVNTPAIPDSLRDGQTYAATSIYDVNIPQDNTVYESYGVQIGE